MRRHMHKPNKYAQYIDEQHVFQQTDLKESRGCNAAWPSVSWAAAADSCGGN